MTTPSSSLTLILTLVVLLAPARPGVRAQDAARDQPPNQDQGKAETGKATSDFALTVYSSADPASFDPRTFAMGNEASILPGYGVVRETRNVTLTKGENTVRFTDVAAGIDPTTVTFRSLTDPDATAVIEQDFAYDLVGADKVLQKYLGQPITVRPKGQPPIEGATLLAAEPATLVLREPENQGGELRLISRTSDLASIDLPRLPEGLMTRPTLIWKVHARKAGPHNAQVSYQTSGLTWRADYILIVDRANTTGDLNAWVTLLNESGLSYPNARLKLVAGNVQHVQPERKQMFFMGARGLAAPAPEAPGFQEKAFFEYHLYTLGHATSLANRSTKQIELFPAKSKVPIEKTYEYFGLNDGFRNFAPSAFNANQDFGVEGGNTKVDIVLLLKNEEASGLGLPLPAGRVRVYQRDEADDSLEFVGEDVIGHTPRGEVVRIRIGSAFDIVGKRKQTDFRVNLGAHVIEESIEIVLRNRKTTPLQVVVKEVPYRSVNWSITRSSDPPEKPDARSLWFTVEVKPGVERKVSYTIRYTW